jgi:hypothetical protein
MVPKTLYMSYPCPYCDGLPHQTICSSSTNLEKHIKSYHGCKPGQAKHLCKECSNEYNTIYFPTATYFAHVFAKGHHTNSTVHKNAIEEEEEEEEEAQFPTSTITSSVSALSKYSTRHSGKSNRSFVYF